MRGLTAEIEGFRRKNELAPNFIILIKKRSHFLSAFGDWSRSRNRPALLCAVPVNFWLVNYHMSGFAHNGTFEMLLVDIGMEDAFDAITR